MRALHSDITPDHHEYPCKLDCINVSRKCLTRYEFHGGKEYLEAAISALNEALSMEDGRKTRGVNMHFQRKNGRNRIYFGEG